MSRVEAASGAKYSAHKEAPRRFEPIAPVGTNYVPVGRPDLDSLRRGQQPASTPAFSSTPAAAVRAPPPPSAPRPAMAASPAPGMGRAPIASTGRVTAPDDAWDAPSVSKPPPPPAASRPPVVSTSRPTPVRSMHCFLTTVQLTNVVPVSFCCDSTSTYRRVISSHQT